MKGVEKLERTKVQSTQYLAVAVFGFFVFHVCYGHSLTSGDSSGSFMCTRLSSAAIARGLRQSGLCGNRNAQLFPKSPVRHSQNYPRVAFFSGRASPTFVDGCSALLRLGPVPEFLKKAG